MLGRAAIAMWWDIAREMDAEFEHWHTHEHMPERLSIPGFLRGTRFKALSGGPSYFILYETRSVATTTQGPYVERLNNPTPWSSKMMSHHRNMVRSLCRVRASFGGGLAHAVATLRFSPLPRKAKPLAQWLSAQALPALPAREGLSGAHLLESLPPAQVPRTAEQAIRGNDARADWVLLVSGYDAEAVKTVLQEELSPERFEVHGAAPGAQVGFYGPSYSLTPQDLR